MVLQVHNSNNTEGSGVLVGNFITAGHVIEQAENPYIKIFGKRIELCESRQIALLNEGNENGYDVAIYDIPEFTSKLVLSDIFPKSGDTLQSLSYKMTALGSELLDCIATVNDIVCGNYFGAETSINLKEGSSGSPVISNGKLMGIMSKGNNDGNGNKNIPELPLSFCLFLSASKIKELLI